MAKIFDISQDIRQIASDAIDDLIDQLGKTCRLVYPARYVACPTCTGDIINKSGHIWTAGGPSAQTGHCSLCNGAKTIAQRDEEDVILLCNWNIRTFTELKTVNVRITNSGAVVQTKGYLTDLPKVLRCEYAIFQVPLLGYKRFAFKLSGEPADTNNIVQARYFNCLWERTGPA